MIYSLTFSDLVMNEYLGGTHGAKQLCVHRSKFHTFSTLNEIRFQNQAVLPYSF